MALIDAYMLKFRPDLPYMTEGEARLFKRLVANGIMTVFRQKPCAGCDGTVPKNKEFCSKKCYEAHHGGPGEDDRVVDG